MPLFKNKNGFEIGGPSSIFHFELPLYAKVKNLDGCNFSNNTVWSGNIETGNNYVYYKKRKGNQYVSEGSHLTAIPSDHYDFLLASHCLEHFANPLKALKEWQRVIKPGGVILLVLPEKSTIFDHRRPVTTFEHLLWDFKNDVDESDLTHLEEILRLHDLSMDPGAGDAANFKQRSLENFKYRCLHHHVFDFALLEQMFHQLNIIILKKKFIAPCHQVIIGQKSFD
ncbi:MAG: methyltransferase domain-containing protein [Bacteroidetes bacterium]|nr:methyltransferase domain-containing protein [Bacteroidota bacterium]